MFLFSLTNLGGRHFSSHWRILEFVIRSKWCVEVKHWGKLVDAYRFLHKEKDMERGFSWSGNPVGKYRGKRMRIDYFVASEKLKDRIVACEMHGQGIELQVLTWDCLDFQPKIYIIDFFPNLPRCSIFEQESILRQLQWHLLY
ncbi:DNA-(apurinic or apyrimidinic site) lyase [Camellia lanceoleosa]|uniref:DNA-(Apurinic or apyrimidinic site) lyase n=1 Tax=Camellia lanceoleosa TaxID=1840588 RepID=A0ACC0IQG6_9ERIC|nr:DNA-(apurinic or apyrimidinic site) lyase [Camellia lanceoleosa]